MTFRVYVRWPGQRVSDKTTTDSRRVAEVAFEELQRRSELAGQGALGIAFTNDRQQVAYHQFLPTSSQPSPRVGGLNVDANENLDS